MTSMLDQTVLNWAFTLIGAGGGWWMKTMWEALKDLQLADKALVDKVAGIDTLVAGQYVRRDYFETKMTALSDGIFRKLDRIEDKLDDKADKPHT